MKNKINSAVKYFILLYIIIILTGCGRLEGEFAFKTFMEDSYKRIDKPLEFNKEETVDWAFVFNNAGDKYDIAVVLMKKELIWVDINTRIQEISPESNIVYGKIQGLEQGNYKIVIANNGTVIGEREFQIYSDDEDYYQ